MVLIELSARGNLGHVCCELLVRVAHSHSRRRQVGSDCFERGHLCGNGRVRGPSDGPQVPVDNHHHQLVTTWCEPVETAQ